MRRTTVAAHLGVLADRIKESNVTLVTGHSDPSRLGGRRSGKVILGSILLELRVDQLVALDTGIDSEETVMSYSKAMVSH